MSGIQIYDIKQILKPMTTKVAETNDLIEVVYLALFFQLFFNKKKMIKIIYTSYFSKDMTFLIKD